jgi:hypothetical protein
MNLLLALAAALGIACTYALVELAQLLGLGGSVL